MEKRELACIYCRLSVEDGIDGVSQSIENQIELCSDFATSLGFQIKDIYIDDGYSGGNFERPEFKRMISDIESNKINCVIVKDLSRFGRNFLKVSYYITEYFAQKKVRFLSMSEGYDSFKNDREELFTLVNFINGYYAKEISKKVRASLKVKAEKQIISSKPPYGYDLVDGRLVVNEETSKVVEFMFQQYVKGVSSSKIATILKNNKVLTPSYYRYIHKGIKKDLSKDKYEWTSTSVNKILKNRVYSGDTVNFKTISLRYGAKQSKNDNPIIIENTHEAIVSKDIYNKAIEIATIKSHKHNNRIGDKERLGKFFYTEDGRVFSAIKYKLKEGEEVYYTIRNHPVRLKGSVIHELLYKDCINVIKEKEINKNNFISNICEKTRQNLNKNNFLEINKKKRELEAYEKVLFEKMLLDEISIEEYEKVSLNNQREIQSLNEKINLYTSNLQIQNMKIKKVQDFFKNLEKVNEADKLTIIRTVIKKVIVSGYKKDISLKIIYNFDC